MLQIPRRIDYRFADIAELHRFIEFARDGVFHQRRSQEAAADHQRGQQQRKDGAAEASPLFRFSSHR